MPSVGQALPRKSRTERENSARSASDKRFIDTAFDWDMAKAQKPIG
jgi:hypothetical protein